MGVYFIRCGEFVKIGLTDAHGGERRLQLMQVNNPEKLELIAEFEGTIANERWLHERFLHLHHRGEWFRAAPEIDQCIADLRRGALVLGVSDKKQVVPLRRWRRGRKPRAAA